VSGWPVYSERLLSTPGHTGWVIWTIPAGHRAVVKHLALVNYGEADVYVQLAIAGEAFFGKDVPGPTDGLQQGGMWVGYGGETIGIYCAGPGCGVGIYGYLFADNSGSEQGFYQRDPGVDVEPPPPIGRS